MQFSAIQLVSKEGNENSAVHIVLTSSADLISIDRTQETAARVLGQGFFQPVKTCLIVLQESESIRSSPPFLTARGRGPVYGHHSSAFFP
jgi:hypothetical protein